MILVFGVLGTRLAYLQIQTGQVYAARAEANRTIDGVDPVAAWPDLRPQGPPAGHQHRDLGGQDHPGRPAVQPARRRRAAARDAAQDGARDDPVHARQRPGLPLRPGPRRRRRAREDRAHRLRVRRRPARASQVNVETRREYPDGPLLAHILGYTGSDRRRHPRPPQVEGLPRRRPHRQGRASSRASSPQLRGTYGTGARRARRDRPRRPGPADDPAGGAGRIAHADDRPHDPEGGDRGAQVGHADGGPQARRVHRDEPADRRGPRHGQPAQLRQQPVRARDLGEGLQGAHLEQERAADEPGGPGQLPARIDVQARRRAPAASPTRRSRRPR